MLKTKTSLRELTQRQRNLQADIYQRAAAMTLHSLEDLCRRLHCIEHKIHSFKGSLYDKDKEQ